MLETGLSHRRLRAGAALPSRKHVPPLLQHLAAAFWARLGDLGKLATPLERPGRVDDRPGVEALLARRDDGIERSAPAPAEDIDVFLRVAPGADGPHHLLEVHHVDVLV